MMEAKTSSETSVIARGAFQRTAFFVVTAAKASNLT
jgi:hypothetical protein